MTSKHETQELLDLARRHLALDEQGGFTWAVPPSRRVSAGRPAGTVSKDGYIVIQIGKQNVPAHRLAWAWRTGRWPTLDIDHIDGVRTNNAHGNLRDVPRRMNTENRRRPGKNSKTGFLGVAATKFGTFTARISVGPRSIYLGSFKSAEGALEAYIAAKRKMHAGNTL